MIPAGTAERHTDAKENCSTIAGWKGGGRGRRKVKLQRRFRVEYLDKEDVRGRWTIHAQEGKVT